MECIKHFFLEFDPVDIVMMADTNLDKDIDDLEESMSTNFHSPINESSMLFKEEILNEYNNNNMLSTIQTLENTEINDIDVVGASLGFSDIDIDANEIIGSEDDLFHIDIGDMIDSIID